MNLSKKPKQPRRAPKKKRSAKQPRKAPFQRPIAPNLDKPYYSIRETAYHIGSSKRSVERMIDLGEFHFMDVAVPNTKKKQVRISREAIQEYRERRTSKNWQTSKTLAQLKAQQKGALNSREID